LSHEGTDVVKEGKMDVLQGELLDSNKTAMAIFGFFYTILWILQVDIVYKQELKEGFTERPLGLSIRVAKIEN
jgi:hypothetical protein